MSKIKIDKELVYSLDGFFKRFIPENVNKSFSNDYISELSHLKLNKNKLLKSEQSLQKEDPLFQSMYDHMRLEATYKEVTKGYRQGQISLEKCDEILKAINKDQKVRYSDNIVFNHEGKLLLLKRSELDKTFPGMYVLPGGHVDAGEDHRTAAIRELQEESGLTPDKDSQFTKVGEYEDDKVCIEYYQSTIDKDNDTLCLQSEEAWSYEWIDPRELDKYEFPLNMKQNIQKMLFPNREIVQKLGKAFKNGKITREKFLQAIDVISKSEKNYDELLKKIKERRYPEGIEDKQYTKEEAEYIYPFKGISSQMCDRCNYWKKEDNCVKVKGEINPKAHCKFQEQKEIGKSFSHKYISKKPDGKGGWVYEYEDEKKETKKYKSEVNSLGQKLGKNEEEISSFWKWFGDSKVVDKNGNPLVVFRGKSSFKSNKKSKNPYYIPGLWFAAPSNDEDNYEEGNAEWVAEQFSDNGEIEKVYLKIENPKIYEDYEDLVDEVERKGGIDGFYQSFKKRDGLHLIGSMTDGDVYRDDYVVFNNDQIRIIKDDVQKSLQSINELYLQNRLSDELYETIIEKAWKKSPIGTIVTRSNGQKWKKVSETGNKDQDWQLVGKPKAGNKTDEPVSKEKRAEYGTKGEQPDISEHAKQSSETALNAAIKESQDPKIREAAHQELDRREKEEHVQEEEKKESGEKEEDKDPLKKKIEDLSDKYKDLMQQSLDDDFLDENKTKELSNKQKELARYVQRIKKFEGFDRDKEIKNVQDFLGLKSEKEVQDLLGDGKILGIKIMGDTVFSVTEDCYVDRSFDTEKGLIHMNEFILNPDIDKGLGKGTEIFSNQVKSFKEKGFKKLLTTAAKSNIYNGYYTWARLGYSLPKDLQYEFESRLEDSGDKDLENIKSLPELMSFQKGRDFWKKKGFEFTGEFDLSDDSKSIFILNKYMEEKKNAKK